MPLFSEADMDVDGYISPEEYVALSQTIIRRTLLVLHASQGAYSDQVRLQRTSNVQLATFTVTPPPARNLSIVPRFRGRPGNKSHRQAAAASAKPWTAPGPLTSLEPTRTEIWLTRAHPPGRPFARHHEAPDSSRGSTALSFNAGHPAEEVRAMVGRVLTDDSYPAEESNVTAEECSWQSNSGYDDVLVCMDGHVCNSATSEESWSCCNQHGGRYQCPLNYPNMCARDMTCAGGTDYCCEDDCSQKGRNRPCYFGCSDMAAADGAFWTDSKLQTCEDYYVLQYCNETGGYGSEWGIYHDGTFADFAGADGTTALEACCACGGGLYASPPSPSLPLQPLPPPLSPPVPPPLPIAPPVSVSGSTVTLNDTAYAFPQLEGTLQDEAVSVVILQAHVALAGNLSEIRRALSIYGECVGSGDAARSLCAITGQNSWRIFTLGEGAVVHLEALELHSGRSQSHGGVLYAAFAEATLVACVLRDSYAFVSGGAVFAYWSRVTCAGCSIFGNVAEETGGAMWGYNRSTLLLDAGTLVEGNIAYGSIVEVDHWSTLILNGSTQLIGNVANGYGTVAVERNSALWVGGNTLIEGNQASMGGGIFVLDSQAVVGGGSVLRGNSVKDSHAAIGLGGVAWSEIYLTEGVKIIGNCATNFGGAIGYEGAGWLKADSGVEIAGNYAPLDGGAVHCRYGNDAVFEEVTVCNNVAGRWGGALELEQGATVLFSRSLLCNNSAGATADSGDGGAVSCADSVFRAASAVLEGNTATKRGGAVYADTSCMVELANTVVANNSAETGGGVYGASYSQVTVTNGSTVVRNVAVLNGGGVFGGENTVVTVKGGSYLALNVVTDGDGGGLYADAYATLDVAEGSRVQGNSATEKGGGLSLGMGCHVNLMDATVKENVAHLGGGLYAAEDAVVNVINSEVSDNQGSNGGGLYGAADARIEVEGSVISGNVATDDGGGVLFHHLIAHGSRIETNEGTTGGGLCGYHFAEIENVNITLNTAEVGGALVFRPTGDGRGGNLYLASSILQLNRAKDYGAGIVAGSEQSQHKETVFMWLEDTAIQDNEAVNFGGEHPPPCPPRCWETLQSALLPVLPPLAAETCSPLSASAPSQRHVQSALLPCSSSPHRGRRGQSALPPVLSPSSASGRRSPLCCLCPPL
ncbi:hypothetical protein CYMTET_50288 [Cymbomonas tetramitiformis]|uniref:Uncharacterized protein n=1 Tax=Cymbomonas tetramitiformis TaxID=36881 RepID=A0AAE0ETA2_9CHLO|nr:hypothetical protein CYMTET_50288 [Cymbomonas tetramitiformis]